MLVAEAFVEKLGEDRTDVNHIDGDKTSNFYRNLEWVTKSENAKHALNLGLRKSGEEHKDCKLTDSQIKEIRSKYTPKSILQEN